MRIEDNHLEFDWDKGNKDKNKKHSVEDAESEEPFFDPNKVILKKPVYANQEERSILVGKTKSERLLFVVFTKRKNEIRIISARDINRKERCLYEETPEASKI